MSLSMTEYMTGVGAFVPCILSTVTGVWDVVMAHAPMCAFVLCGFFGICVKYALDLWLAGRNLVNTSDMDEMRVLEHQHAEMVSRLRERRMVSDLYAEDVEYVEKNAETGGRIEI